MEKLSFDCFSSCLQTLSMIDNYHHKRWFCRFFAFTAQNMSNTIAKCSIFTKTNMTHDCKHSSKTVKIVKHTAKKAKSNELYDICVSWGRFQCIYQNKNFSPKSLFLLIFCLLGIKCVKTHANYSNLNEKLNSRHWLNFPKTWGKIEFYEQKRCFGAFFAFRAENAFKHTQNEVFSPKLKV